MQQGGADRGDVQHGAASEHAERTRCAGGFVLLDELCSGDAEVASATATGGNRRGPFEGGVVSSVDVNKIVGDTRLLLVRDIQTKQRLKLAAADCRRSTFPDLMFATVDTKKSHCVVARGVERTDGGGCIRSGGRSASATPRLWLGGRGPD